MKDLFYCGDCEAMQSTTIIEKEETLSVKGCPITLTVPVRVCAVCGEEILDADLDDNTLDLFYNEYRKQKNLLSPERIQAIRNKYQLSQASFSKLLGFGEKTITRYENGAIQDACHDNIIRLMESMEIFIRLWKVRKDCLTPKEQERVEAIIEEHNNKKIVVYNSTYSKKKTYWITQASNYQTNEGDLPDAI